MALVHLRDATPQDLPAINAIYNYYVLHSTATYQMEPETDEARRAWFVAHDPKHPVIVATENEQVVGWGSLNPFHRRIAYRHTVENSVYIRHDRLRRGIGRMVLDELVRRARAIGHHTILASISADQAPSIELHLRAGFVETAHLREVGNKYGPWLDVVYLQLMLE